MVKWHLLKRVPFLYIISKGIKTPIVLRSWIWYLVFQLRIQVYDSALPDVRAEQSYNVKVNRNPSNPAFLASFYSISIKENYAIGGAVISVNATDADGVSLEFNIDPLVASLLCV